MEADRENGAPTDVHEYTTNSQNCLCQFWAALAEDQKSPCIWNHGIPIVFSDSHFHLQTIFTELVMVRRIILNGGTYHEY